MPIRHLPQLAAILALGLALATPVAAQEASVAAFEPVCLAAEAFLLPEPPAGVEPAAVLTPLCGCLVTAFKTYPQADVDMLTSDLAGTATAESHTAYGDYNALEEKAGEALRGCFSSPEVTAIIGSAPAPAAPDAPPVAN